MPLKDQVSPEPAARCPGPLVAQRGEEAMAMWFLGFEKAGILEIQIVGGRWVIFRILDPPSMFKSPIVLYTLIQQTKFNLVQNDDNK